MREFYEVKEIKEVDEVKDPNKQIKEIQKKRSVIDIDFIMNTSLSQLIAMNEAHQNK